MISSKKRKLGVVIIAVAALLGIIGYRIYVNTTANKLRAEQMSQVKAIAVQVGTVGRRDMQPLMVFSGSLEPIWSADISAKGDGRLNTLTVNEGDMVQAGAVVGTLDTNELGAQLVQAQGNVMGAQASLEQAELDYRRYSALAAQGAISAQVLDNARTKRDLAAGQVRAAEGALMQTQEKYNNSNIIVTRAGVVTKRYLQAGTFARAGSPILAVADVSTLLAKATVGEGQIGELAVGAPVSVKIDALAGQSYAGTIVRISPTAALPARTFTADIAIPNENGLLKVGMFAKVEIPLQTRTAVLAIPESALVMREDQKTVFVVLPEHQVQQRVIKTGFTGEGWAELLEGVNEGETIVLAGQNKIRDGATVTPLKDGGS